MTPVQRTVEQLVTQLKLSVKTGQVTLNLRDGRLESWETKTYARFVEKTAVDNGLKIVQSQR